MNLFDYINEFFSSTAIRNFVYGWVLGQAVVSTSIMVYRVVQSVI
jgi:hypothetical protein